MSRLTNRRRVFIEEYLSCWNGAEAARRAGYAYPHREQNRLLRNAKIRETIEKRVAEKAMGTDELLLRLAAQARGRLGEFLVLEEEAPRVRVDWNKIVSEDVGDLVKSISFSAHGPRLEIYDAQSALVQLAKLKGLYIERHEVGFDLDALFASLPPEVCTELRRFLAGAIAEGDDS